MNPDSNEYSASSKRKRLTQACDCCRKMKVRCDAIKPSCSTCCRLNIPCTFLTGNKRRGPRQNMMDEFGFLSGVSGNFQQTVLKMDGGKIFEVTSSQVAEEANELDIESPQDQFSQNSPMSSKCLENSPPVKSETPIDFSIQKPTFLVENSPSEVKSPTFLPPTTQLQVPSHFCLPSQSPLLSDSTEEFPNSDPISLLISIFFNYIHVHIPIIHKSTFMKNYFEGKVENILLSSICALALRFQPQNSEDSVDPTHARYFEDNILSCCENTSIEVLQALLLMSTYEISYGRQNRSCVYIGMATRLSQIMKIHRIDEYSNPPEKYDSSAWINVETKRRAWWYCCTLDHILSAEGKYPVGVDVTASTVSLPVESSNWESGIPTHNQTLKLSNGLPLFQAENDVELTPFSALATLSIIVARVNKFYAEWEFLNFDERRQEFERLDEAINNWESALPPSIRYVPIQDAQRTEVFLFNSFLFSMEQATIIKLNATRMRVPGQEMAYDIKSPYFGQALRNSFIAAKHILSVVHEIKDQPSVRIHPFFGFSVFSAATFYLHGARSKNPEQSQRSLLCFKFLVKVLRQLNSFWKNCGNYCNFLLETLKILKKEVAQTEFTRMSIGNPLRDLTATSVSQPSSPFSPRSNSTLSERNIDEVITEVIVQRYPFQKPPEKQD
ncbi:hypothetical protein K7432_005840 [Basidiobolus ranarum]|uniref:Zn(2)-C6 fungal-type domain-containing protein n=1 Tax=Basidiobolus ranarum TaxID=34480 RepID=A0ABR2W3F6_9FUNG